MSTAAATTRGRLLHLGNVVVDVVVSVPALPERGGDVLAGASRCLAGGGFNVMAAAARLGMPVAYGGASGTGALATLAHAAMVAEGITEIGPAKTGLDTGFALTMVEPDGERTFLTSPGAEATLTAADLDRVRPEPGDAIYLSGYGLAHESNRAAILSWLGGVSGDHVVFFDPGPLVGSIPADALAAVLHRADWLICNAREATILTGNADPAAAAGLLAAGPGLGGPGLSGPGLGGPGLGGPGPSGAPPGMAGPGRGEAGLSRQPRVLVRRGADGCLIGYPDRAVVPVPGYAVEVADTNGAGDTHSGALIAALARGADEVTAARIANAAAAISVTRNGPATAPDTRELASFLISAGTPGIGQVFII